MLLASTSSKQDSVFPIHILSHPCPVNEEYIPNVSGLVLSHRICHLQSSFVCYLSIYATGQNNSYTIPLPPAPSTSEQDWQNSVYYINTHWEGCRQDNGEGTRTRSKENVEKEKYFICILKYRKLTQIKLIPEQYAFYSSNIYCHMGLLNTGFGKERQEHKVA